MNTKMPVWIGLTIGSSIGSYIPSLWGAGMFSFSSLLFSAIGSIIGIYLGFKISQD
jgi:uncharacterized membrane protein YeaQ/YmgE (transglycosylase-associated protein family)